MQPPNRGGDVSNGFPPDASERVKENRARPTTLPSPLDTMPFMKTFRHFTLAAGVLALAAVPSFAQDKPLPDGDGKDLVQKVCSACHDVGTATSETHTAAEWKGVINTMKGRGAEGSDADFDKIIAYLAKNFGSSK